MSRTTLFVAVAALFVGAFAVADDLPETTDKPLLDARKGFVAVSKISGFQPDGAPFVPPKEKLAVVRYDSPAGKLAAYQSPDPGDGKKRPAVILVHGGWGGIGEYEATDPAWAPLFLDAGFVVFVPSWRAECDNPGRFEMFLGEVDDLLAAVDHVAKLPYVDASRIYMAGHSTGGTMTMLAAEATTRIRAAFALGGCPDLGALIQRGGMYKVHAFPEDDPREAWMRSPIHFVPTLKTPTFYFEGQSSPYPQDARRMERLAAAAKAPFHAFIVKGGDHFDVVGPALRLVCAKIRDDVGATCNVTILEGEAQKAWDDDFKKRLDAAAVEQVKKDDAVLGELAKSGSDLTKPHRVEHFVYASSSAPLERLAEAAKKHEFETSGPEKRTGKDGKTFFVLVLAKTVVPTADEIHRESGYCLGFALRARLEYDGWRAAVVK